MRKYSNLIIAFFMMLSLEAFPAWGAEQKWAVYWYLCGSDLESRFGAASADLEEVLAARIPNDVTVVIQTGGTKQWSHEGISARHIERYVYQQGRLKRIEQLPQGNMGDQKTLASFLGFCKTAFPAERQAFIFWNHGGGSVGGVANDQNFGGDALSLREIRQAFESVHTASENKPPFELIGFDTCLMATLDTANTLLGFGRYFVASQDLEPGNGWYYTGWLNALGKKPSMDGAELGKIICDTYMQGCRAVGTETSATLSLVDMTKLPALNIAYNALGIEAVSVAVDQPDFYAALGRQAKASENYMNSKSEGFTNMVDIGSLVRNMKRHLPEFTDFVLQALDEAVIYKVSGVYRKPSGLSCYYPFDGSRKSFGNMMATGNVTSFLVLNGLQLGFLEPDEAVKRLESISQEISDAVDSEEGGAPSTPAPSVPSESEQAEPSNPSPSIVLPTIPGGGSGGGATGSGSGGQASLFALLNQFPGQMGSVAPLETLDISSLEDIDVGITDDGSAELVLGPERLKYIDSVAFYLSYYSVEDDVILLLGKDADMDADWERGVFKDNFRGVWAALDGHLVYMEISNEEEGYNRYAVPIMLNGVRYNLVVMYDFSTEKYRILGARKVLENDMADKSLIKLKAGDEIGTVMKAMSISGDDDEFHDVTVDTFKIGDSPVFEDIDMGDGTFMFMFEMTDVQNNSATSKIVTIEVKGGEIFLSNE